jgi:hypothetical protein
MNIRQEISELGLPEDSYLVVGSSVLAALGLRDPYDIDMIVTDEVFKMLSERGWQQHQAVDQILLRQGNFDIGTIWSGMKIEDLQDTAMVIDGLPCISLQHLKAWKVRRGTEKDRLDVELIDNYLMTHS